MGNQVRTLRTLSKRERKRKLTVKQKNKTEKVKTGKSVEAFPRIAILSTIFEDAESDSDINDISEEENNNKERIVKGRIPELSSRMENEDNKQQEPAEPGKTETPETLETPETPEIPEIRKKTETSETPERRMTFSKEESIAEIITEDNVHQIIEGLLTEGTSLSDLESGKIYYYYLQPKSYHAVYKKPPSTGLNYIC